MPVSGQVEVGRLDLVRSSPFYFVLVSVLPDTELGEVADGPFTDFAGVEQPRGAAFQAPWIIRGLP
jgi:hypothetical protein